MKDRFAILSEIEIGMPAPNPASEIASSQRLFAAAALVDLLRDAGLDCHLVPPASDDSAQEPICDDESPGRKTAKTPLQ